MKMKKLTIQQTKEQQEKIINLVLDKDLDYIILSKNAEKAITEIRVKRLFRLWQKQNAKSTEIQ